METGFSTPRQGQQIAAINEERGSRPLWDNRQNLFSKMLLAYNTLSRRIERPFNA